MWHARRQVDDFAGASVNDFGGFFLSDSHLEVTLEHDHHLLVFMIVEWNVASCFESDACDHEALADMPLPDELLHGGIGGEFLPCRMMASMHDVLAWGEHRAQGRKARRPAESTPRERPGRGHSAPGRAMVDFAAQVEHLVPILLSSCIMGGLWGARAFRTSRQPNRARECRPCRSLESLDVKKLYVGNLPFSATEADVTELFAKHGNVHSVALINDRETGRPRGFGFVEMDDDAADAAMQALNGFSMDGRDLRVNEAQERPRRGGGGGGGGGGGRW